MTLITVEIPKEQDLDSMLALFRQMNLRVVVKKATAKNGQRSNGSVAASVKKQLLAKPMRATFDKEAIKRAQNWKGKHDKVAMMQLIKDMNVQEPIEKLLAQLSK